MTKQAPKLSTLLTRAAKWVDEHGLAKGAFFKYRNGRSINWNNLDDLLEVVREKGCPACARGALYVVDDPSLTPYEREQRHSQASSYIENALDFGGHGLYSIPDWNDRDETTKEEVVMGLKEAAKAARRDGK